MRVIVAMLIAGVGCTTTHRSTLPPYVQDLRPVAGGIEVTGCEIVYVQVDRQRWDWFAFDTRNETETRLEHGRCLRGFLSTTVEAQP